VVRIGFRPVSRVLKLLAGLLASRKRHARQTIINWVMRLSIVRIEAARTLKGLPLSQTPFTNSLLWMIDISIGLGTSKILAVLACDAHYHQLTPGALLARPCPLSWVGVAASWTGETIAELLKRLIAQIGRPSSLPQRRGQRTPKGRGLTGGARTSSPCLDDISHAVAGMLKRVYQDHPSFETFLSACWSGLVASSSTRCWRVLTPPKVRTKARFMHVHRLCTWAD